jgi:hypothetical protein
MDNQNIYEIDNNKRNDFSKKKIYSTEYSLKRNNFNPSKDSPNFFMTKLEIRMKSYYLEEQLNNDPFSLDTK